MPSTSRMWTDFEHAFRAVRHHRRVLALSVACLGLGIGVVTMVFAVVNGVLLQPVPLRDPAGLLQVTERSTRSAGTADAISPERFDDWRGRPLVAEVAALRSLAVTTARGEQSERRQAIAGTANVLAVLGIDVVAGRAFRDADDRPGADPVLLIGEAVWRSELGADPAIVGSRLAVNGRRATVIGIVPDLAHPAVPGALRSATLWLPLGSAAGDAPTETRALSVIARTPRGDDPARIAAALAAQLTNITAGRGEAGWTAHVAPLDLSVSPTTRAMLLSITAAALLVLLIGCTNVANLLLLGSTARQREIATRIALGASRGRIAAQLLMESAMIGLASAPVGIFLGWAGRNWMLRASGDGVGAALPIDLPVIAMAIGAGLATSFVFGLAPALQAMRTPAREALGGGGHQATTGRATHRLRLVFAATEIVLSLVLLLSASLLARSFAKLLDVDRELDLGDVVVVALGAPEERRESPAETARAIDDIRARVARLPGVTSTAVSDFLPLRRSGPALAARRAEDALTAPARTVRRNGISAGFFETMGVAFDAGRPFTGAEAAAGEEVAVVNRRLADLLWPNGDAIGEGLRFGDEPLSRTIVGVVRNISNWDVNGRPLPTAYVPLADPQTGRRVLVVRTAGEATMALAGIRSAVAAVDRAGRDAEPLLLETVSRDAFFRQRALAVLFGVFSTLSVLLTAIGLYGVLSYFVSQRRRELGIRAALGASRRDLMWLVARQSALVLAVGGAIGLLAALGAGRVLRSLLFEVQATDPVSLNVTAGLLLLVAAIASWAPARHAASTDPAALLRSE